MVLIRNTFLNRTVIISTCHPKNFERTSRGGIWRAKFSEALLKVTNNQLTHSRNGNEIEFIRQNIN